MNTRRTRLTLAAAVILIVLGGLAFWPSGSPQDSLWWLGPRAAWGQDILDSLENMQTVIYRQRSGYTSDYGPPKMSRGYEIRFNAKDRYRRDRYDDGVNLMNIQWVIPKGNDLLMIEVSHTYECYFTRRNEAYGFVENFTEEMRSYVEYLDRADRLLGTEVFDGRECVGFEVRTAKYGDDPKERFDRIWFDVKTRLPARIERYGRFGIDAGRTMVLIHDQFHYYAEVPGDLFTPVIPEGYLNAHPDEVRNAGDKQVQDETPRAEVPAERKERILAALRSVQVGSYREGSARISFTRDLWRKDTYDAANLPLRTHWYLWHVNVPEGPFEPEALPVLTETVVDFVRQTYQVVDREEQSAPRHPMADILFVAGLIDKADRWYESERLDGIECVRFDVSASKYGDNPEGAVHRVWFDAATDLPLRMEMHWPHRDGTGTSTTVQDQFEWNCALPQDFFTPQIPPGFAYAQD